MQIRAAVFNGSDEPLVFTDFHEPSLSSGEVLVRVDLAAVCGSDLHTLAGTRLEHTPCVLGHEGVGTVVSADAAAAVRVGQRITWTIADSCGHCRRCVRDRLPQKCERLFKYGHAPLTDGSGLNGTYATHIVLRSGTTLIPVPDAVTDAVVVSANCALATMVGAVRAMRTDLEGAESVMIQGAGLLGIYGVALLLDAGIPRVMCTDVDPTRLTTAAEFGAIPIDCSDSSAARREIHRWAPRGVDAVIEVAGVSALLAQGVESLRVGGWYGLVGLVHPDSAFPFTAERVIRQCLALRGIHNYAPQDLVDAVSFLQRRHGAYPFERLMSEPMELGQLPSAFDRAQQREFLRITIKP
jgi:putative phosphonate catabolism associated alcohol dehydrogenase